MFSLPNIALLGAAQGLMLALAIVSISYGNRRANMILALFIAVLSLRLGVIGLEYQTDSENRYPEALFVLLHLSYAIGPLLYGYVRLLVQPHWRLRAVHLWHFLPVPLAVLMLMPGGPVVDIETAQFTSFDSLPPYIKTRVALASTPVFVSLLVYSVLALRLMRPYQQAIKEQFSALENINLDWLKALVWCCMSIAAISFVTELYRALGDGDFGPRAVYSVVFSVLLIYYIGLMGLRQPQIFDQGERHSETADTAAPDATASQPAMASTEPEQERKPEAATDKYQKSGLSDERVEALWQKLGQLMDEQQPYLQPGIKLGELAQMVGTRPNYLSQVINSRAGESFFDYINRHRIEEAAVLLREQPERSVSDIALATGFGSQNVFNGHFKKRLGVTPTQYRKRPK